MWWDEGGMSATRQELFMSAAPQHKKKKLAVKACRRSLFQGRMSPHNQRLLLRCSSWSRYCLSLAGRHFGFATGCLPRRFKARCHPAEGRRGSLSALLSSTGAQLA